MGQYTLHNCQRKGGPSLKYFHFYQQGGKIHKSAHASFLLHKKVLEFATLIAYKPSEV